MKLFTLSDKRELEQFEWPLLSLFQECFGQSLSSPLWKWAYIENPHGSPFVSMCEDNGKIVGHYAMIPFPMYAMGKMPLNAYLSMTTMVAPTHRKYGLFVKLAELTYAEAHKHSADCVIGFPNEMSIPGFRKRLNWSLDVMDYVVCIDRSTLLSTKPLRDLFDSKDKYCLDMFNMETRSWRLNKPGVKYFWNDGIITKKHGEHIDLLFSNNSSFLENLPDNIMINVLVPGDISELRPYKIFDYQFGGRGFDNALDVKNFSRMMIMSDVF